MDTKHTEPGALALEAAIRPLLDALDTAQQGLDLLAGEDGGLEARLSIIREVSGVIRAALDAVRRG